MEYGSTLSIKGPSTTESESNIDALRSRLAVCVEQARSLSIRAANAADATFGTAPTDINAGGPTCDPTGLALAEQVNELGYQLDRIANALSRFG